MESKYIDIFERFIEKQLNEDELKAFNSKLNLDIQFKKEFEAYNEINTTLQNQKIREFRTMIKDIHENEFGSKKKRKIQMYRYAAAASFLILVVIGFLLWNTNYSKSNKNDIFSTYYADLHISKSEADKIYLNAANAYKNKEFESATNLFSQLSVKEPENEAFQFYLAMSYLGKGDMQNAQEIFEKQYQQKSSLFTDNIQWYLGVVYYKTKQYKKALELFTTIANNPKHYNTKKAQRAIEQINKEIE